MRMRGSTRWMAEMSVAFDSRETGWTASKGNLTIAERILGLGELNSLDFFANIYNCCPTILWGVHKTTD